MELIVLLFVMGVLTLLFGWVALSVVGALASAALSVGVVLLFTVGPVVLVGWAVWKLLGGGAGPQRLSAADRRWLEHGDG